MSHPRHPSAHDLGCFVEGALTEDVAVSVALHLDGCPACATHVASMDPLAAAFAAVDDPPVPSALLEALHIEARTPARRGPEPMIAAALLGVGTILLLMAGGPAQTVAGMATVFRALLTVGEVVASQGGAVLLVAWAATAAMLLTAAVTAARSMDLRRTA